MVLAIVKKRADATMMPSYRVEASPSSAVPHACIAQPYSPVPIDT